MANTHSTLSALFAAIANAIRAKTGSSAAIVADQFPSAISAISTGVDTSDATASAGDILSGKTAYVKGSKVTGTIASQAAKTVTPTTSAQTAVASGVYTTGAVTVAGDANLVPANIKSGVSIFGVTGSAASGGGIKTGTAQVSGAGYVDFSFTAVGDDSAIIYILTDSTNTMFCYSLPVDGTGTRTWVGQRYTSESVDGHATVSPTLNGNTCTVRWYVDPNGYDYFGFSPTYYLITA